MNSFQPIQRQSKVFMVIMLYNLTTLNFAFNWSCRTSAFIGNGPKFMTIYQELIKPIPVGPIWDAYNGLHLYYHLKLPHGM